MPGIKELKTRIKSIGSTRKITRAMQMVSAAKMRKSQTAVLQSRSYASLAWQMIENLSNITVLENPLIKTYPKATKTGVILLTSNRGLVGSLNTNLLGKIKEIDNLSLTLPKLGEGTQNEVLCELITYGKKGQIIAGRLNKKIMADFPKFDRPITVEDIYPLSQFITQSYGSGQYKNIVIVYNHFISTLAQKASVKQLLPFVSDLNSANTDVSEPTTLNLDPTTIFEPNPQVVIEHLIPRIIESQIYQTILESDASEHSARMVMMKNATEAAGDLIADYTLTYNQLRQGKITTELAEITAGRIALE